MGTGLTRSPWWKWATRRECARGGAIPGVVGTEMIKALLSGEGGAQESRGRQHAVSVSLEGGIGEQEQGQRPGFLFWFCHAGYI